MKKLQVAYSRKEKLEKLITNLEDSKKDEEITTEQYNSIMDNYHILHKESVQSVDDIKDALRKNLGEKQSELNNLKQDLDSFDIRVKIGEMSETDCQKVKDKTRKIIKKKEHEVVNLEALIDTNSSSDVGGLLEVSIEVPKGPASTVKRIFPIAFRENAKGDNEITIRPYLISLILGTVMLISIFLPWVSADLGFGSIFTFTANGTEYGWGILSMIMSIICIPISFITDNKIKGIGLMSSGILAVIGVVAYWFVGVRGETILIGTVSPSYGLIITSLAAIGIFITGVIQYRRST